jgi:hypothetical protein
MIHPGYAGMIAYNPVSLIMNDIMTVYRSEAKGSTMRASLRKETGPSYE